MSLVQFGTATLDATIDRYQSATLNVIYAPSTLPICATRTCVLKGIPLSIFDSGKGTFALGVVANTAPAAPPKTGPPTVSRGQKYGLSLYGGKQYLYVNNQTGGSTAIVKTQMFRGVPFAVNQSNQLLVQLAGSTYVPDATAIDQEVQMYLGTNYFVVRRYGPRWWLVVADPTGGV